MERRSNTQTMEGLSYCSQYIKKRDAIAYQNYRSVSLVNTVYKVLSNIILNRLKLYAKEIIGGYQAGFTAGKSITEQIHAIKQITDKSDAFDKDV